MEYFLASLPILAVILLLFLRIPSLYVVSIAIVIALVLAFRFPISSELLADAIPSTLELSLTLALIMFSGIALANIQQTSGAQRDINTWLNRLVADPERAALFYGMAMVPLIESLVGWGLGVIIGIPMLLGSGLPKLKAIQISLLGLMLCPWGSFAPSLYVITEFTGHSQTAIGTSTALFNVPVVFVLSVVILLVLSEKRPRVRLWIECLTAAFAMSLTLVVLNAFAPSLSGVVAALASTVVFILFARSERHEYDPPTSLALRGLVPYAIVLVGLTLSTLLTAFIAPSAFSKLLVNPALWLTAAVAFAPLLMRVKRSEFGPTFASSVRAWGSAFSVTLLFVLFGMLLSLNGMGATLAQGIAILGGAFAVLVPLSGFVAGFVTSSNTAAAAMLSGPLNIAASGLGVDAVHAVGAQTAATGAAVMCSPARAELARQTANLLSPGGDQGITVMRILLPAIIANGAILVIHAGMSAVLF